MKTKSILKASHLVLVSSIIFLLLISISCAEKENGLKAGEEPLLKADVMPVFPEGDAGLLKFIAENVKYPEAAKTNGIQGRVIVQFCVTKAGKVERATIKEGVSKEIDEESLRVINTLPAFTPAKQDGKPVSVWYMVPITFTLR